jgi:hypothetical protein
MEVAWLSPLKMVGYSLRGSRVVPLSKGFFGSFEFFTEFDKYGG